MTPRWKFPVRTVSIHRGATPPIEPWSGTSAGLGLDQQRPPHWSSESRPTAAGQRGESCREAVREQRVKSVQHNFNDGEKLSKMEAKAPGSNPSCGPAASSLHPRSSALSFLPPGEQQRAETET
ncbi:hypothetical protein ILYODFUR_017579 [Ilyodon furcidens]|uniref:Uncharacterized protein n=2 Tax=Goodeidae TaxID=28758 RepID=A0ABV0UIA4_9TELE